MYCDGINIDRGLEIQANLQPFDFALGQVSNLPKERVKALIAEFIGNFNDYIRRLEVFDSVVKNKFDLKDFYFQAATLHFSIDHLQFLRNWYQKFLDGLHEEDSNFTIRVSNMGFRIFIDDPGKEIS